MSWGILITKYSIVDKNCVIKKRLKRIVIFTVFEIVATHIWKEYGSFPKSISNLNTDYLLLDTEQIDFVLYLDASLIIIGGGNTRKIYSYLYVNQEVQKLYRSYA